MIEAPTRTPEIHDAIVEGRHPYGMVSFDQSLTELVQQNLVTYEVALRHATNPDDFALHFRGIADTRNWVDPGSGSYGQEPG